ncbi:MAG: tRNA (adenosine(37)-N6)-dimethylallyltransferase MiaA [Deltaproteobacteria bacterium]|nr:tRNA (adenosine(37)-N6)-dimethylallyltransferase MiaA [Deltaproteobacteria bacterium]
MSPRKPDQLPDSAATSRKNSAGLPPLVAVVGPTASGKSSLAMELALRFNGEIINTDAMQVYRGFDIGTAKPGAADLERVPHHLLDCVEADQEYSAGSYVRDARLVLAGLKQRARLPLLCGGTGLYFRALLQGLADIPDIPPEIREEVACELERRGAPALHGELVAVDPEMASRLHPNDRARVARALEVFRATGRSLAFFQEQRPFTLDMPGVLTLGVAWERPRLYERINARVEQMLDRGWVDEVRGLLAQGLDPGLKPFRAIGYAEITRALLAGGRDFEPDREALAGAIAQSTRNYAKRQLTWFRRHPGVIWFSPETTGQALEAVAGFLQDAG